MSVVCFVWSSKHYNYFIAPPVVQYCIYTQEHTYSIYVIPLCGASYECVTYKPSILYRSPTNELGSLLS